MGDISLGNVQAPPDGTSFLLYLDNAAHFFSKKTPRDRL